MPLVDDVVLLIEPGMTGATGNVYVGLVEFADMAFVMHFLRPHDRFLDIGANVGVYTLLAAGGRSADCVAVEPIDTAFRQLTANVRINRLEGRVRAVNVGLSSAPGKLRFTRSLDTVNHVLAPNEAIEGPAIEVDVTTVDALASEATPHLIKIDVEGFETEVLAGAHATLASPSLGAIIIELNGSGARYGFDEGALHEKICSYGFTPHAYDPLRRELSVLAGKNADGGNTIYVRDANATVERLRSAPSFRVLGRDV